jgi:hypothetical protein
MFNVPEKKSLSALALLFLDAIAIGQFTPFI